MKKTANISFRHIEPVSVAEDLVDLKKEFFDIYRQAFGGPPYHEKYSNEELDKIWELHRGRNSHVVFAIADSEVAGFGCYHWPLDIRGQDVARFLDNHQDRIPFKLSEGIYMSELAVNESQRNHGIGSSLVFERLEYAKNLGYTHFIMRTAAEGSNSIHIYKKIVGGEIIDDLVQHIGKKKTDSDSRIWCYGNISKCLAHRDATS